MPDGAQPLPPAIPDASQSFDEYSLHVAQAQQRAHEGDDTAMWGVLRDLGAQIANVRHDLATTRTTIDAQNARLYGYRDGDTRGGDIGELKAGQRRINRLGWAILSTLLALGVEQIPALISHLQQHP